MKTKVVIIIIICFYILVLFQTSFLIYFNLVGILPNLVLIAVILINLLEKKQENLGIFSSLVGGFFLDIFSENFIGFYILILVGLSFSIKLIFKEYVRVPLVRGA